MFLFDDLRTDLGPTATNTADLMNWLYDWVEVLSRPDSPPPATAGRDPLMLAFAALSRRVRACTTQELWRRWVDTHRLFCWGALWESAQRTTRTATSFDAFLSARAYLAGSPCPCSPARSPTTCVSPKPNETTRWCAPPWRPHG